MDLKHWGVLSIIPWVERCLQETCWTLTMVLT